MTPLYGFLEGDTLGLLLLADEQETMGSLAQKLVSSASVRVAPSPDVCVYVDGKLLPDSLTVEAAGLTALDRLDVRRR